MTKHSGYRSQKSKIRKKAGKKQGGCISFSLRPSPSNLSGPLLISACLMGINSRYNGKHALNQRVIKKYSGQILIPVCPEQLGGLPTPRPKAEITASKGGEKGGVKVIDRNNKDVTKEFIKGAKEVLKIAKLLKIKKAVLKEKSPSCGVKFIYRDTKLVNGNGITTRLLEENGVEAEGVE